MLFQNSLKYLILEWLIIRKNAGTVLCSSLLGICLQSLKSIVLAVFALDLAWRSPARNLSLPKFLRLWKLQHQIPFKHIFS